jgi:Spy/CpxP family protein refolding chaperone
MEMLSHILQEKTLTDKRNILMNKLIITIAGSLLIFSGGVAMAQDDVRGERNKNRQHQQRGMQTMPVVDQMMRALRHLDLSMEQKQNTKAIMSDMRAQIRPLAQETRQNQQELQQLVKAEVYDEQAVATLAGNEGDLAAERVRIVSKAMSDIFAQLTDEQHAKLDELAAQRHQKRGNNRGKQANKEPLDG